MTFQQPQSQDENTVFFYPKQFKIHLKLIKRRI
jgi:hypothetical protein